jgi:hypothetical protein
MHENHAPIYEHEQHAQQQNATAGSSTAPALEMGANGYPVCLPLLTHRFVRLFSLCVADLYLSLVAVG